MNADQAWARVRDGFLAEDDIGVGRMFTAEGLHRNGKYFAMLCRGELVVKVPATRVDELEASGLGARFEPGPGRRMREWLSIPVAKQRRWLALANEALDYARELGATGRAGSARPRR